MEKKNLDDLLMVMNKLRDEGGCPWDREQDGDSLKPYLIEETYEVLEAIESKEPEKIKEELGDLLYQIIFHSKIAQEKKEFDIFDVIGGIYEKMVRRHPHVFGSEQVRDSEHVLENWEKIKIKEKGNKGKSILGGVPKETPALLRAFRLQSKAARVGFDWKKTEDVLGKLDEEVEEFKHAVNSGDKEHMQEEMGDILFVMANIARHCNVEPENALRGSTDKFISRFNYIEDNIHKKDKTLTDASLDEMEELWNEAKKVGG